MRVYGFFGVINDCKGLGVVDCWGLIERQESDSVVY
jgi:hypothetical protein